MWPFSSSSSSSSFSAELPSQAAPASVGAGGSLPAPPPPSPTVAAPAHPTTPALPSERLPAPGRSSPATELAAQDAEEDSRPPPGSLPKPVNGTSAIDTKALLIVAAGVAIATTGPSFFRLPPKSPAKAAIVLGAWSVTSYALVAHLTEKFKQQEFLEWEAKRMSDLQASSLDKAPLQATGFEGGFGGQEGLRDKYATTSGEH